MYPPLGTLVLARRSCHNTKLCSGITHRELPVSPSRSIYALYRVLYLVLAILSQDTRVRWGVLVACIRLHAGTNEAAVPKQALIRCFSFPSIRLLRVDKKCTTGRT